MKKNSSVLVGLLVVMIIAIGGFLLLHNSSQPKPSSSSAKSTAPAVNNAVLLTKTDSSLGQYLATPDGMPLYTYDKDASGVSNCTGSCLAAWPAYQNTGSTSGLPDGVGTIKRSDNGQLQYTYHGMPLYTFVSDSKGHVTGEGVDSFRLAKPSASPSSSSTSAPSNSSSQTTNSDQSSLPSDY